MLIFEQSRPGRKTGAQMPQAGQPPTLDWPAALIRELPPALPEVSELQVVRHYTKLSQQNFSIDTNFYPLGSCTMKYNPRGAHKAANQPGFLNQHPLAPDHSRQGTLAALYQLQEILKTVSGMSSVSLAPMAGAQGEFAGISMIRAYHHAEGSHHKNEIIVPDSAHGTNPASAVMCGYLIKEVPTAPNGDIDIEKLKAAVNENTAGLMLTNPSTCGLFERQIEEIAQIVHQAQGLLYYDGANLNAILGRVRPGDMGFDVMHLNLHKTFATPHGGGGPGAGPVCAVEKLAPYLPIPTVTKSKDNEYQLDTHNSQSIGRLSAFNGNTGILIRALAYALILGKQGMLRVSEYAVLNSNYLARKLARHGFNLAYPERRPAHEFTLTFKQFKKDYQANAMDVAKRLLDFGIHSPTAYFPLLVPECLLIEPTETETLAELDGFIEALLAIKKEAETDPENLRNGPHHCYRERLDEVQAAKNLDLCWEAKAEAT